MYCNCLVAILDAWNILEQLEEVCMILHAALSQIRLFLLVVLEIGTDWIKFCLIAKFSRESQSNLVRFHHSKMQSSIEIH